MFDMHQVKFVFIHQSAQVFNHCRLPGKHCLQRQTRRDGLEHIEQTLTRRYREEVGLFTQIPNFFWVLIEFAAHCQKGYFMAAAGKLANKI